MAAPFRKAGGVLPPEPPKGWPYDVQWVQLVSVGIDFYPRLAVRRPGGDLGARLLGRSRLAEFALVAILAEAKRLPDVWIDKAERWAPQPRKLVAGTTLGPGRLWRDRRGPAHAPRPWA